MGLFNKEFKELTEAEEETLEKNLVWILSFPRSGTTWLGTQLLSFNTKSINEIRISEHIAFSVPEIKHKLVRRLDQLQDYQDYFFSKKFRNVWMYFLRKMILNRVYAQHNTLSQKIIIKEPTPFDASDIISECLPSSKLIFLWRDGRDVMDSLVDAKSGGFMVKAGQTPLAKEQKLIFLKNQSNLWVNVMENMLKTFQIHTKENSFQIKYEDLRKNTFHELKKLYEFIGIRIDDDELKKIVDKYSFENLPQEIKGKGKFHRAANPGLWKKNFNENEINVLEESMRSTLKKLEYEV